LGVNFEGPIVKLPKRLFKGKEVGPAIGINLDVIDMDVASFWSADQRLTFDGRVSVDLNFDKSVEIRVQGETEFSTRNSVTVSLGDTIEFKQVANGVRITPVFSARNNRFTNDTKLLLTLAYQQTMGAIELYGLVPDLAAGVFDLPTNVAISQVTPQFADPFTLYASQPDPENLVSYGLSGFADVTGAAISVVDTSAPGNGGGSGSGGNGGDSGSDSSNGGGGSASALEIACLFGLLVLILVVRRRYG
jgi:hypothetical protein